MNLRSLSKAAVRRKKLDESNAVYSVESILKKRWKEGRREYFVKWKGWPVRYNTWEPEENFLDAEVIQEFEKELEKKKRSTNRMGNNNSPKNGSVNDKKEKLNQQVDQQDDHQDDNHEENEEQQEDAEFWRRKSSLVDKMLITDVFANDMTITVKEFLVLDQPN